MDEQRATSFNDRQNLIIQYEARHWVSAITEPKSSVVRVIIPQ